jgi:hypothetical protein
VPRILRLALTPVLATTVVATTVVATTVVATTGALNLVPANAAASASRLVWTPAYLAHVTSGRIISATAPSARSVWALGRTFPAHGAGYSFLLRFDGRHWRKTGMPARGANAELIASSAPGDVWMFGWSKPGGTYQAWHWNGKRWLWTALPAGQFGISGAAALGPANVWVVTPGGVQHWNGHSWQPSTLPTGYEYKAISGVGGNLWVAGLAPGTQDLTGTLVVFRWQGGRWHKVGLPATGLIRAPRQPMVAASATTTWVSAPSGKPVLLHWYGGRWHKLTDPSPLSQDLAVYGRGGVWADWGRVWTGSRWVSVSYPGRQQLPTGFTTVPGSTSAWLFGAANGGPEVLRAAWQ